MGLELALREKELPLRFKLSVDLLLRWIEVPKLVWLLIPESGPFFDGSRPVDALPDLGGTFAGLVGGAEEVDLLSREEELKRPGVPLPAVEVGQAFLEPDLLLLLDDLFPEALDFAQRRPPISARIVLCLLLLFLTSRTRRNTVSIPLSETTLIPIGTVIRFGLFPYISLRVETSGTTRLSPRRTVVVMK